MITRRRLTVVSLAAILALAIAACARVQPSTGEVEAATPEPRPAIIFDNAANDYVDVYLASEQREWRLGRVPPGVKSTLRVPLDELVGTPGFVRLVVLAGSPVSVQAARDPHAITTIPQPVSQLLAQRWTFSHAQSMSAQILGSRIANPRR